LTEAAVAIDVLAIVPGAKAEEGALICGAARAYKVGLSNILNGKETGRWTEEIF